MDYTKDYLDWQKLVNKLESETLSKQDIKELPRLSKLLNLKYQVNSSGKLEDIVDYIDRIDHNPKADDGIKGLNGRIFEGNNGN